MVAAAPAVEAVAARGAAGAASRGAAKKAPAKKAPAKKAPAKKAAAKKAVTGAPASGSGELGAQLLTPPEPPKPPTPEQTAQQADGLLTGTADSLKTLGKDAADKVTLTPPRRLTAGDASGFAAGLVLYCLFINYLKYGPKGVRGWISAKFINKPLTGVTPK
jgi:hypothetical protein